MSGFVILIVLAAALLHALWNAMLKGAVDRTVALGLVALGHVVPGVILMAVLPAPGWAAAPFIVASTVIHWGYYVFLNVSYRLGDLSLVYPVARGLAPVLIALGATVWAEEYLNLFAWTGILTVTAGILALVAHRNGSGRWPAAAAALATTGFIAAYSVVDGLGIRLAVSPLSYIAWLFAAEFFIVGFVLIARTDRVRATAIRTLGVGFSGGLLSALAYGLALYAKTLAPLGMVSALRETSVVFAALIGVVWFGERPIVRRVLAAAIVGAGIAVLALA